MKLRSIKTRWFVFHPRTYGIATLMRVGFRVNGHQLLLHHFYPHAETEFHNHPWGFRTLVLWGGYVDESTAVEGGPVIADVLRVGSTRYRPALHTHRTRCDRHTWTLVHTGPKERDWCKGMPANWICDGDVEDFDTKRGMVKV